VGAAVETVRSIHHLRYLLTKGKVKPLDLTSYITTEQCALLKHEYLDDSCVHHRIIEPTVGYTPDGKLAFVYLKKVVPRSEIAKAKLGMDHMKWYGTKQSHRKALRGSGGHELQFGWSDGFGEIRQFVPTIAQSEQYKFTWPYWTVWMASSLAPYRNFGLRPISRISGSLGSSVPLPKCSSFSTVTMLRNAPTSIHQDSNNAEAGLTVLTTAGKYTGGEFLFPQSEWRSLFNRGTLIAATHREWHCNFKRVVGLRYSIIGYFREGLR